MSKNYSEKLQDPRWQKLRLKIMDAASFRCEDCKAGDKQLEIHHTAYIAGKLPHEYDIALLMCLCADCHKKRQAVEDAIRVSMGKITRFLPLQQVESEAWNMVEQMSLRETERLAESFS
jgi:5-methylcytosine-specific restriction endonuclease McrA